MERTASLHFQTLRMTCWQGEALGLKTVVVKKGQKSVEPSSTTLRPTKWSSHLQHSLCKLVGLIFTCPLSTLRNLRKWNRNPELHFEPPSIPTHSTFNLLPTHLTHTSRLLNETKKNLHSCQDKCIYNLQFDSTYGFDFFKVQKWNNSMQNGKMYTIFYVDVQQKWRASYRIRDSI